MNTKEQVIAVAGFSIDPKTGNEECVKVQCAQDMSEATRIYNAWAKEDPEMVPSYRPIWLH